jgi:hypothetical protein
MDLTAMRITRDPTGAIGIGLTDTGATIEKVRPDLPSGRAEPSSAKGRKYPDGFPN